MLLRIDPDHIPDWTVFTFAGFLVGVATFGVFLMTPEPAAESASCAPAAMVALPMPSEPEPPKNAIERPSEDWLWMAPEEAEAVEEAGEPRRRRHRRRG